MNARSCARFWRLLAAVAVLAALVAVAAETARAQAAPPQAGAAQSSARSATSFAATIRDGRAAARELLKQSGAPSVLPSRA